MSHMKDFSVFSCESLGFLMILFKIFDILPNEWIMNQTDLHLEKSDLHNIHIETFVSHENVTSDAIGVFRISFY